MKRNQTGFAVIESLLVGIILALIGGTGYYVWHSTQHTDKALVANNSEVINTKKAPTMVDASGAQKHLIIKEWGVDIPYKSDDTLSYKIDFQSAAIISANLAKNYGCVDYGAGSIGRFIGNDQPDDGEVPTVAHDYALHPERYKKLGDYYFTFGHDQAACSNGTGAGEPGHPTAGEQAQSTANDFTKSLISHIRPIQ